MFVGIDVAKAELVISILPVTRSSALASRQAPNRNPSENLALVS